MNMAVRVLLKGQDFESVVVAFPFVAGFVDRATRYVQYARMHKYIQCAQGLKID